MKILNNREHRLHLILNVSNLVWCTFMCVATAWAAVHDDKHRVLFTAMSVVMGMATISQALLVWYWAQRKDAEQ